MVVGSGEHSLPKVSSCNYLGIYFSSNGAWDMHIKKLLENGRKKVNQLYKVISNKNINLNARKLLLLSVIRPTIEYGSEVWKVNKSQAGSLESISDRAKRIHGCSSKGQSTLIHFWKRIECALAQTSLNAH